MLENINDKFSQVLEGHTALNKNIGDIKEDLRCFKKETNEKFEVVFEFIDETRGNFKSVFEYLIRIDEEVQSIRRDMKELHKSLSSKVEYNRFEKLEKRVIQIELILQKSKLQTSQ